MKRPHYPEFKRTEVYKQILIDFYNKNRSENGRSNAIYNESHSKIIYENFIWGTFKLISDANGTNQTCLIGKVQYSIQL